MNKPMEMRQGFQGMEDSDCNNEEDERNNRLYQSNYYQANANNMGVTPWTGHHGFHPASMGGFPQQPTGFAFPFPGPQHYAVPAPQPLTHFHRSSSTASNLSTGKSRREALKNEETPLGPHFKPGPWHVLCGRSKHNFDHIGNRRLRIMVANNLKAYVECPSRRDKTELISRVADEIRLGCHGGGFVRKEKGGAWVEVGPTISREKVSHAFRDSLLKNARRSSRSPPPGDQQEGGNRQYSWREAQDEVFGMLNLCSEPERADQPAALSPAGVARNGSHMPRSGTAGVAMQAGAAGNDLPVHAATHQLYANLYQPQQGTPRPHSNQGLRQTTHSQSQSENSDQISEDLAYSDPFLWI